MEEEYHAEDEGSREEAHKPPKKDQRVLVGVFVFLFVGISIVGLQGITRSIQHPFTREEGSDSISLEKLSLDTDQEQTDETLKKLDTDMDGLSDYDEISLYGTSVFLDDSDGDGYTDKTEILTGHDPSCNETAQQCGPSQGGLASLPVSTSTEHIPRLSTGLLGPDGKPTGELSFGSRAISDTSAAVTLPGFDKPMTIDELRNLSPQDIRAFLIRQGGSEKDLKKIDDATLKKIYAQGFESAFEKVRKEQEIPGSPLSSLPSVSTILSQPSLGQTETQQQKDFNPKAMTAQELRDLLRKSGKISEEDIQKIDDATLKAFAEQAYQEIKGNN